eukprot:558854-Ditylum_brightwellii.AAC.1
MFQWTSLSPQANHKRTGPPSPQDCDPFLTGATTPKWPCTPPKNGHIPHPKLVMHYHCKNNHTPPPQNGHTPPPQHQYTCELDLHWLVVKLYS